MKIHTYLIHETKEWYAKKTEEELREYLEFWHLSYGEIDILFDLGSYRHDNLGVITYETFDI